jgi:O-antigen ligase
VSTSSRARRVGLDAGAIVAGSLIAIVIAIYTGLTIVSGGSKIAVLLPFALPAVALLVGLALTRFEWLVVLLLAARASLDAAKLSAAPAEIVRNGAAPPATRGLDPAAIIAMGFVLAALVWLVWNRTARQQVERPPALERALCLLVLLWGLSIVGSDRPITSFFEIIRISSVMLMLIVLNRLITNLDRLKTVLTAVFVSAVVPLGVAAYQAASTSGRFQAGGFSRIRATFVHPNPFALYLTFIIVMGVALLPHIQGRVRILLSVLLSACGVALVLTYTRTAWICVVIGLIVIGILQSKRLLGVMFIGAIVVLLAVPSIAGRFADLSEGEQASGSSANSLIWRFDYWTETLPLANSNPATGIGLKMSQFKTAEQKAPHNDFIRAYVETGVLGLLAYLWLIAMLLRTAWDAVVRAASRFERGVAVGFAACVAAFVTMSFVSNVASQVVLLWYFFAFAACAIAVSRFGTKPQPAKAPVAASAP